MSDPVPVQHGYDLWAKVYDHDANPLQALEEPIMRRAIGKVAGLNVLDLGCGTGRHALSLAAAGARVTAVDFSSEMLAEAKAKEHADKVAFVVHDLSEPLPFPAGTDAEFDLVVCGLVLEHIKLLPPFFAQIAGVLKASGQVVVSFMHPAMFARGSQARFTDPDTEQRVLVESTQHSVSSVVMAALGAGLEIKNLTEHSPDADFAEEYPRAEKYIGWPMLVVFDLRKRREW